MSISSLHVIEFSTDRDDTKDRVVSLFENNNRGWDEIDVAQEASGKHVITTLRRAKLYSKVSVLWDIIQDALEFQSDFLSGDMTATVAVCWGTDHRGGWEGEIKYRLDELGCYKAS